MTDSMKTHNMEQRITAIRARLKRLSTEQEKLEQELHELLLIRQRTISSWSPPARTSDQYPPDKKIRIFRSLFRGREDVFPRRFESMKTGKAVISRYVPTSGDAEFVPSRKSNVLNANIENGFRFLTTL